MRNIGTILAGLTEVLVFTAGAVAILLAANITL